MRQRVKIVIKEEIVRELYAIAGEDAVQTAEPMKNHTTFRVGGPADYFVAPHTEEEIRKIVALCEEKEIPWFVTGNGSNLVVSDEGYHGVILSVYKNFQGIEVERNRIRAKAGSMLVSISQAAREAGLSGMEFASGIPGTLGGGVRMNAGAYGGTVNIEYGNYDCFFMRSPFYQICDRVDRIAFDTNEYYVCFSSILFCCASFHWNGMIAFQI